MNRFIKLLILLLFAAIPAYGQALWNGFQPQQTASNPLQLRVADGDLSSVLGISTFLSKNLTMAANDTTYVYLDLTTVPPILSQNTTGFPTSQAYTIAIVTTNASKITNVVDARPPWNTLLFGGSGIVNVTNPPTGFCTSGVPPEQVISSGAIYTCQFNQWGQISGAQGMTFCGNWSATQSYALNCVVIFNNSSYVSLVANTGQSPLNITYWQPLANTVQNGIIAGCGVNWTSGYNFTVGACEYGIQNTIYNSPLTNITLAAADPSLDRIDTIYVDTSGSVAVLTGTPSANPTPPTVDPLTQLALSFVYVTANTTQPSQISTEVIYAENTSPPEWACTASANLNCGSTNNPYAGTKDVEATTAVTGNNAAFVKPASGTEDLSTWDTLFFYIRSKAAWPSGSSITLQWLNASTPVGNPVVLRDGQFGFNSVTSSIYQQVAIAASLFGTGSNVVTTLKMTVTSTTNIGFYADNVILQRGQSNLNLPTGIMIFRGTWNNSIAYNTFDVVTSGCGTGTCSYVALSANTNTSLATGTVWRPLSSVNGVATCTVNGVAYYNSTTGLTCVTAPTVNGNYQVGYTVTASAAVPPATQLSGLTQVPISGATATYTVTTANCGGQVISHDVAGSQNVAVTLPTATTLLNAGCAFEYANYSTHTDTITPTTWTVNGSASKSVPTNSACLLTVDKVSATNWLADCHFISTTGGTGGGITSINTVATGPNVDIVGAGGAIVTTSGNTVTVNGALGPPTPTWQNANASYTVPDSDNGYRDRSPTVGTYTLGTPNSNASSPLVGLRVISGGITSTPFTSSSFAQSSGNQMVVAVTRVYGANPVTSVTNSLGDSFVKKCEVLNASTPSSLSIWYASNLTASGSATLTVTFSATPGAADVYAEEVHGTTYDSVNCLDSASALGVSSPVHFASAVAFGIQANNSNFVGTGFTNLGQATSSRISYRLLNNSSQVTYIDTADPNITVGVIVLSSTSVTTYATGWSVLTENVITGGGYLTVSPPGGVNINGQASNIQVPNMACNNLVGTSSYDTVCGFIPNINVYGNIGAAVEIGSRITNNTGSDIGSTTIVTTGAIDGAYTVEASITCRSAVAGQPTLTIGWTDTSNTAQTKATTGVDCTSLGASSWGSLNFSFRAKASTNITLATTHGNSQPTVDVDVSVYQRHTQ